MVLTLKEAQPITDSVSNKESGSLIRPHIGLHPTFPQPHQDRTGDRHLFLISVVKVEDALLFVKGKNGKMKVKQRLQGRGAAKPD